MQFLIVFQNVLVMLAYMVCGFALVKWKKMVTEHARSLSGFLVYICSPCLVLSSFQQMEYSVQLIKNAGVFFAAGFGFMAAFFGLMYLLLHKKHDDARFRIMTLGCVTGNTGFFGLPLVNALFPELPEAACFCLMYTAAMNVIIFTAGVFMLTRDKKYMSLKEAFLNPTSIAVVFSLALYLLKIRIPDVAESKIQLLGSMATPLCMAALGMRLASMDVKQVFCQPFAYAVSALKLVIYPLFVLVCLSIIPGVSDVFRVTMYIASCAPCAVMMLSLAEMHDVSQKLAANAVLLSTLISVIVLPLMTFLV